MACCEFNIFYSIINYDGLKLNTLSRDIESVWLPGWKGRQNEERFGTFSIESLPAIMTFSVLCNTSLDSDHGQKFCSLLKGQLMPKLIMAIYKDPGHDWLILLPVRVKSIKMKSEQLNISVFPVWMNSSDNKMKGQQAANTKEIKGLRKKAGLVFASHFCSWK